MARVSMSRFHKPEADKAVKKTTATPSVNKEGGVAKKVTPKKIYKTFGSFFKKTAKIHDPEVDYRISDSAVVSAENMLYNYLKRFILEANRLNIARKKKTLTVNTVKAAASLLMTGTFCSSVIGKGEYALQKYLIETNTAAVERAAKKKVEAVKKATETDAPEPATENVVEA